MTQSIISKKKKTISDGHGEIITDVTSMTSTDKKFILSKDIVNRIRLHYIYHSYNCSLIPIRLHRCRKLSGHIGNRYCILRYCVVGNIPDFITGTGRSLLQSPSGIEPLYSQLF